MQDTTKEETKPSSTNTSSNCDEPSPKLDISSLQREDSENSRPLFTRKPVSVKGSAGIVLLYQNIQDRNWDEVIERFEKNEHNSKSWIEEVNPDGSLRWRSLPMHLVSISSSRSTS